MRIRPALVSIRISDLSLISLLSFKKAIKHLIPLPHISGSEPSELNILIFTKHLFLDSNTRIIPSAPMPKFLLHRCSIKLSLFSVNKLSKLLPRASKIIKSLPSP